MWDGLLGCGDSFILLIEPLVLATAPSALWSLHLLGFPVGLVMACAYEWGTGRCLSFLSQLATPDLVQWQSSYCSSFPLSHFLKYYGWAICVCVCVWRGGKKEGDGWGGLEHLLLWKCKTPWSSSSISSRGQCCTSKGGPAPCLGAVVWEMIIRVLPLPSIGIFTSTLDLDINRWGSGKQRPCHIPLAPRIWQTIDAQQ